MSFRWKSKSSMIIKRLMIILILWLFIHFCFLMYFGLNDKINYSDAAVIYGHQVENDGSPSRRLKSRLDRAIELYNKGFYKYIIVSGRIDINRHDEAKVMAEYLVSNGIPKDVIVEDNTGFNSYLTALNVQKISRRYDIKSVLVISQYYHILRIKLSFL